MTDSYRVREQELLQAGIIKEVDAWKQFVELCYSQDGEITHADGNFLYKAINFTFTIKPPANATTLARQKRKLDKQLEAALKTIDSMELDLSRYETVLRQLQADLSGQDKKPASKHSFWLLPLIDAWLQDWSHETHPGYAPSTSRGSRAFHERALAYGQAIGQVPMVGRGSCDISRQIRNALEEHKQQLLEEFGDNIDHFYKAYRG